MRAVSHGTHAVTYVSFTKTELRVLKVYMCYWVMLVYDADFFNRHNGNQEDGYKGYKNGERGSYVNSKHLSKVFRWVVPVTLVEELERHKTGSLKISWRTSRLSIQVATH